MPHIYLKRRAEIERMRTAGKVVARVLQALQEASRPGATTADLDQLAAKIIAAAGGRASFLNYKVSEKVYPAHICTSVNAEVVHGIPGSRTLNEGDIVGVDVGVFLNGFHADSAATFAVGQIAPDAQQLLDVTQGALAAGVSVARAGRRVGHISNAVQRYAEARGFHVVKALVGHGVGRKLHEEPNVPNFGQVTDGEKLEVGMTLAVEPMLSIGTHEVVGLEDEWTIMTADGSLSAHFEHTIAITRNGADILTL